MSKLVYVCPACKSHNSPSNKNCIRCGNWLLSTAYPPQVLKVRSTAAKVITIIAASIGGVILLFVILIVAIFTFVDTESNEVASNQAVTQQDKTPDGTRRDPINLGQSHIFSVEQYFALTGAGKQRFDLSITVNKSIRGDEAQKLVTKWNEYNPAPAAGHEYMLAEITVRADKSKSGDPLSVNSNTFSLVSENGVKYDPVFLVTEGEVYKELYEGAQHTGWAVFAVRTDDTKPLIEVAGNWFSTN
ncbi:DUF4352 domain-containing protein [Paenibacillus sp. LHD-117]|uniref:DUF4352 domain-containing protein n=1 Tax=Paenibacillus sp. LHD-117 TaxID=3071412 RepID=UPI0027DF9B85|nr:DUF4352 domain-containing protein [Paenibacillus sp. LHD-117]MDQ6419928.1 DUF4352 domain-containing protein [Paenibacillus sp. LHD-117]